MREREGRGAFNHYQCPPNGASAHPITASTHPMVGESDLERGREEGGIQSLPVPTQWCEEYYVYSLASALHIHVAGAYVHTHVQPTLHIAWHFQTEDES